MRFVFFYHSLVSDWNHPAAHSLRGVATELQTLGHSVRILEPLDGWSLHNLREQGGEGVVKAFHATFPLLRSSFYDPITLSLDEALADADIVIAHEWNDPAFLRRLNEHRRHHNHYRLLFHDAPHRVLRNPMDARGRVLSNFDGVLASTDALRELYEHHDWVARVWTWREGVDARVFRRRSADPGQSRDLIWVGSWESGERLSALNEFLLEPIRNLRLRARFYGPRYPADALRALRAHGIDYAGWLPDFCIPSAFAAGRYTVHVPLRLGGGGFPEHSPVLRVLQALACGMPLVSAPWEEAEDMFSPGSDLLIGRTGHDVQRHLLTLHNDPDVAQFIASNGYQTVMSRHTCAHRTHELLTICRRLRSGDSRRDADLEVSSVMTGTRQEATARSRSPAAWN